MFDLRESLPVVLLTLFATACGGGPKDASEAGEEPEMSMIDDGGMPAMDMAPGGGMMEDMEAQMAAMAGVTGDSLMARLPMHRQSVANMIARMNREMREMDMAGDAAWNATVDSLRQDLVRMPEMDTAELEAMMPEHRGRAMRLMEMHRAMMADMGR